MPACDDENQELEKLVVQAVRGWIRREKERVLRGDEATITIVLRQQESLGYDEMPVPRFLEARIDEKIKRDTIEGSV